MAAHHQALARRASPTAASDPSQAPPFGFPDDTALVCISDHGNRSGLLTWCQIDTMLSVYLTQLEGGRHVRMALHEGSSDDACPLLLPRAAGAPGGRAVVLVLRPHHHAGGRPPGLG